MTGDKLALGAVAALAALGLVQRRGGRNHSQIREMIERGSESAGAAGTILQAFELASSLGIPRHQIDLSGMSFGNADVTEDNDGTFMSLHGENLCGIRFDRSFFAYCSFARCTFAGASLVDVEMWGADMAGVDFSGADLQESLFDSGSIFQGASFCGAKVSRMKIVNSDLRGADLSGAVGLEDARLVGNTWDQDTLWPPGFTPPPSR